MVKGFGCTNNGARSENEDRYLCIDELPLVEGNCDKILSLYAVFDGHGGCRAAEFAETKLEQILIQNEFFGKDSIQLMKSSVIQLEENFKIEARRSHGLGYRFNDGTTALLALLEEEKTTGRLTLTIANLGDSRAVLGTRRKRSIKTKALTVDHQASNRTEQDRIYRNGGYVSRDRNIGFQPPPPHNCFTKLRDRLNPRPLRVYPGGLVVSRCIGDFDVKTGGIVVAVPQVERFHLDPSVDEFLCLATDGLWDVMTVKDVEKFKRTDGASLSQELVSEALKRKTVDNVTVVVINLK